MQAVWLGPLGVGALLVSVSLLAFGCGAATALDPGSDDVLCDPGEEVPCACPGGGIGTQRCGPDRAFLACDCDGAFDASVEETDGATEGGAPIGGGPSSGDIACGILNPTRCNAAAGERCCILAPGIDHCIGPDEACECTGPDCVTTVAECDGPEDCDDGQVCCGTFDGQAYVSIRCQASCEGSDERELCHPGGAPCSNPSASCTRSPSLPPSLYRCE